MASFWRRLVSSPEPIVAEDPLPVPSSFRSRALTYLLEGRPKGAPWQVLDLGPPSQANLSFFAQLGASYTVEDLYRSILPCYQGASIRTDCIESLPNLLEFNSERRFDLVLAWDLLNFLPRESHEILASRLAPHCHEGTYIYALLTMEDKIPQTPGKVVILDDKTIELRNWETDRTRPSLKHTSSVLSDSMAPFVVDKTYLLKVHMQEYLLELSCKK